MSALHLSTAAQSLDLPTCVVLVVEPPAAGADRLSALLEAEGHEVVAVHSLDEAVRVLDLEGVDLLLADAGLAPELQAGLARVCARRPGLPAVHLVASPAAAGPAELLAEPRNAARLREALGQASTRRRIRRHRGRSMMLDEALERAYMVYQPVERARSGCTVGYEALLRVAGPRFTGAEPLLRLAGTLGRLDEVDDRVRYLLARELEEGAQLRTFFVNLHMDELVRGVLGTSRDPLTPFATRIIVEFGHDVDLPDGAAMRDTLARIRGLGFRLAVGDVAIATEDLLHLRVLQPEIYKLGVAAIHRCDQSPEKRDWIRRIVDVAHRDGALVVAQGIERPDEREVAVELGCDLLQGFLIGLPSATL